jgi:hypothetical protein
VDVCTPIDSFCRGLERSSEEGATGRAARRVQVAAPMRDTESMKRLKKPRLLRRDWIGDSVLTIVAGTLLLASVFLPWVNDDAPGWVNFSLSKSNQFNGVLQTRWGVPALGLAAVVVVVGVLMLLTRPRKYSILLGVAVATCGIAVFGVAQDAAAHIGYMSPGVGMYVTTLVGVLLVPIGLAASAVAWLLARAPMDLPAGPVAPTAPPAPESAPPS